MRAFESYLLILESGAGGYVAASKEEEARALTARLNGQGWMFGCRSGSGPTSKKRGKRNARVIGPHWVVRVEC
jgi:hypothetical protein